MRLGDIRIHGEVFEPDRPSMERFKLFGLPEEPLKNAAVAGMTVAENIAFRTFDRAPIATFGGGWLKAAPMRRQAQALVKRYRVKTPSLDAPIARSALGGNVQRAVLARECPGRSMC